MRHPVVASCCLALLAAGLLAGRPDPQAEPVRRSAPEPPTVLITGANRGLGLEFARQFHADGARVIGTARVPEQATELRALGVRVEQLDVTDPGSVAALAEALEGERLDILINNAGIGAREQSIATLDLEAADRIWQVNCLGPMRVTQALLPALRRGDGKRVINITSRLGSLELNGHGGYYGYRESKAALNMFTRSLAHELGSDGFVCVVLSPGWVRTDMGGSNAPLSPAESIAGMRRVIEGLKSRDNGHFFNHAGERLPW